MKIATRLALLQWQANPAGPANLGRLILAWITPGIRETADNKKIQGRIDEEIARARKKAGQAVLAEVGASPAALLGALAEIMERHPTGLMGTSRLPAPKQIMKAVIKEVWPQEPGLRPQLMQAYLHLSSFQDGIGDAVLDPKLPDIKRRADGTPDLEAVRQQAIELNGPKGENFRQWIRWSKVSLAEMEILSEEWRAFEDQAYD
ncbi:MAG TPA: hypothetical protein VM755_16565 [Stellaceae bacterium]|nr:hypothetical protein [Stellaceae bacterium]